MLILHYNLFSHQQLVANLFSFAKNKHTLSLITSSRLFIISQSVIICPRAFIDILTPAVPLPPYIQRLMSSLPQQATIVRSLNPLNQTRINSIPMS